MKKAFTILRGVLLFVLILLTLFYITFQLPVVQDKISGFVSAYLSNTLDTKVEIKRLRFHFFNRFSVEGLYVEDQQGNSLLQVKKFELQLKGIPGWEDSTVIENIAAAGIKIHLQRSDSNWQHAFLLQFFKTSSSKNKRPVQSNLQLHLKTITLQEVEFLETDRWNGQSITASVKNLVLEASPFSLEDGNFEVNKLSLLHPTVKIRAFPGKRPPTPFSRSSMKPGWELDGKRFFVHALEILDGSFGFDNTAPLAKNGFDKNHIHIKGIQATLSNSLITGDTLQSKLKISAAEKSGFSVRSLSGNFLLSPRNLSLKQFKLVTNQSTIQDQLELSFEKLSDLQDFGNRVFINAQINQSIISSEDLSFFIPALRGKRGALQVAGMLKGTLNEWTIQQLALQTTADSYLQGTLTAKGILNKNTFGYSLQLKRSQIMGKDVSSWLSITQPSLKSTLESIKYVRFNGTIEGTNTSSQINGVAATGLGQLKSQLRLTYLPNLPLQYAGSLSLNQFSLGKLVGMPALETLSVSIQLNGTGIGEKNTTATARALISSLTYNGKPLNNIALLAQLNQDQIELRTSIDNENLKTGNLVARINWENKKPTYQLSGQIEKADFKSLRITDLPIQFKGSIDANLTGNTLTDLEGDVTLRAITLLHDEDLLPIDSLQIVARNQNGNKRIELNTNELQAWIDGRFKVEEFPSLAQSILHRHYPSFFPRPSYMSKNNQFRFEITTQLIDPFFPLFLPGLTGLNNSRLQGEFDDSAARFNATMNIPQFRYQQMGADNLTVDIGGIGDSLYIRTYAGVVQLNETIQLPPVTLLINGKNAATNVSILTAAIMDGHNLAAGAIAGVTTIRNPITAARAVMEKSEHVMLSGIGAEQFAKEKGIELVDPSYFHTPQRWRSLERARQRDSLERLKKSIEPVAIEEALERRKEKYGTVGAVALDKHGNLAAATSTGGMTNKKWGRIGDAPLIGAGTYANNASAAISCTGWGEFFIRLVMAKSICDQLEYGGKSLQEAANLMVLKKLPELGGDGGLIAVDKNGNIAMPFCTEGMYRGFIRQDSANGPVKKEVALFKD